MAEQDDIVLGVKVKDTEAKNSVKSLRTELRQLTNELANLEPGSEAFITAAKRAGQLRDQMDDAKNAVNAFNPEAKFQAFASAIGGVANGFSVVQGAMQLFGAENKRIEEMMAKTQAAIAIATGLNGLLGMGDSIKLLGSQIRNAIPILRQFSAAAVGAFTLGIGTAIILVISYWEDLKALITGTTEQVKLSTKEIQESVQKGHDEFKKAANDRISIKEREAKVNLKGAELDKELAKLSMERKVNEAIASGKLAEQKVLIEKEYQKDIKDIEKKYADERKEKEKKDKEERQKKYNEQFKDDADFYAKLSKRDEDEAKKEEKRKESLRQSDEDERLYKIETAKSIFEDTKSTEEEKNKALAELRKLDWENQSQWANAEIELDKKKAEAKINQLNITANALKTFSDIAGQNTAEGKALSVASTLISTYLSAQKAYESAFLPVPNVASPFIGALSAAAAVASGLANVNAILSVKVPNEGGSSATASISRPALPPMVRPSSNMVSLGNQTVKTQSNGIDQKVYVVESDITNTQNKVKSIESKATIG
jgi:hypothetical protein